MKPTAVSKIQASNQLQCSRSSAESEVDMRTFSTHQRMTTSSSHSSASTLFSTYIRVAFSGLLISSCVLSTAASIFMSSMNSVLPSRRAEATTSQQVCSWNQATYLSAEAARSDVSSGGIMHCEACGACSTRHDVNIYNATKDTLTSTATKCAVVALFFGDAASKSCLQKHVGFTEDCEQCWVSNIRCTIKRCSTICIANWALDRSGGRQPVSGTVEVQQGRPGIWNPCLACDENECGPAFKQCAGANRRRAGIHTDIDRSTEELCKTVDPAPPS